MNERKIGILISYVNIVLHAVVGFVYVPLLIHYAGTSEYGLYQLIGSFIAYFGIMDFGLTAAVVRFYAKYKAVNDRVGMENVLAIALRAYSVVTLVLLGIGCICYFELESIFGHSMTASEIVSAQRLFVLLLLNMVLTISTMIFKAVINAHERYLFLKGLETVQLVLQPLLVLVVLQAHPYAVSVAVVQTVLNVVLIVCRIYYCFCSLKIRIRFHYWDRELIGGFKKLALSVFVVMLIDQIFFRTNQVILGIVSGTTAVAVYSVAAVIYMNYMALSTAISGVYLPHVTELVAKNEPTARLSELFIEIGRWQFYLLALVLSGFVIFGERFIDLWVGANFADAYWMTLLIIVPFTIDLIQNIGLAIMQAKNQYDFRAKVLLCMGIFNLLLAVPLAEQYGGLGCAAVTGLAMFVGNGLVMNWYYARVIGIDIAGFWRQIARIGLGVAVLTVGGYWLNDVVALRSVAGYGVSIVIYTAIYGVVVYCRFMNESERMKVDRVKARLVGCRWRL